MLKSFDILVQCPSKLASLLVIHIALHITHGY